MMAVMTEKRDTESQLEDREKRISISNPEYYDLPNMKLFPKAKRGW